MRKQYLDLLTNCGHSLVSTVVTLLLKQGKVEAANQLFLSTIPTDIPETILDATADDMSRYQRVLNAYFLDLLFKSPENTFDARHALVVCSNIEDWLYHFDHRVISALA